MVTTPLANIVASRNSLAESNKKTTVFIGNISEYTTDEFMRTLMGKCGTIESWKRVLGANGKYQSFGFCEFQDQEAGLRAMRLLNGFKVGDKALVVKVDAKTRAFLDEYENKNKSSTKRLAQQKYQLPVSTMTFVRAEQDSKSQKEIEQLLDLNSDLLSGKPMMSLGALNTSTLIGEEGQILDEIVGSENRRNVGSQPSITAYMDEVDIAYEKKRFERKRLDKEKLFKEKIKRWETQEGYLSEEFHHYESKLKRKLKRRKDYVDKLVKFVEHYNDDIEDEKYYKDDAWDEKLNFRNEELELDERDANDELNELDEQKKKREKELQEKVNSLKVELPKLNPPNNSFVEPSVQNDDDPKQQVVQKEPSSFNMDVIMVRPIAAVEVDDNTTIMEPDYATYEASATVDQKMSGRKLSTGSLSEFETLPNNELKTKTVEKKQEWSTILGTVAEKNALAELTKEKKSFGIKLNASNNNNSSSQISNSHVVDSDISKLNESGHDDIYVKKKTKLTMITDAEHKEVPLVELPPGYHAESLTPEQKKERIKKIISSIPTDKEELFSYKVMWDHVDKKLMEVRIKPWITRKIKELIGVEEATLVDFICTKVYQKCKPQEVIEAISMILENEAEEFTIKLWRFLIYEATAKMYGLNECSKPLK